MAASIIPITTINANSPYTNVAGLDLAALAANPSLGEIPTNNTRKMLLRITNTAVGDKVFTVKSGVNPPSVMASGDLAVTVTASTTTYLALESERFVGADGNITVAAAAGMTGDVRAYVLGSV